jgi:hypothetical protein
MSRIPRWYQTSKTLEFSTVEEFATHTLVRRNSDEEDGWSDLRICLPRIKLLDDQYAELRAL